MWRYLILVVALLHTTALAQDDWKVVEPPQGICHVTYEGETVIGAAQTKFAVGVLGNNQEAAEKAVDMTHPEYREFWIDCHGKRFKKYWHKTSVSPIAKGLLTRVESITVVPEGVLFQTFPSESTKEFSTKGSVEYVKGKITGSAVMSFSNMTELPLFAALGFKNSTGTPKQLNFGRDNVVPLGKMRVLKFSDHASQSGEVTFNSDGTVKQTRYDFGGGNLTECIVSEYKVLQGLNIPASWTYTTMFRDTMMQKGEFRLTSAEWLAIEDGSIFSLEIAKDKVVYDEDSKNKLLSNADGTLRPLESSAPRLQWSTTSIVSSVLVVLAMVLVFGAIAVKFFQKER